MYTQHFGLHEAPFGITPNPAFFYSGNTRGEILSALLYAVTHGEGIVKVTGDCLDNCSKANFALS